MRMVSMVFTFVLPACTIAWGQQSEYESFEEGVPAHFTATRAESLSISPWHSKQGDHSLRWDWRGGEELVIHHGIGDVARRGGYNCRASFSVWVYMEEPIADALAFEFREGDEVTGWFHFPLEFTGWRQGRPFYHDFPNGAPTADVDNLRITAPTAVAEGTLFLDFVKYNTLTYAGNAVDPEKMARWRPPAPDEARFPRPHSVTEAELAGIRKLLGPEEGSGIAQSRVADLVGKVTALGITRDEHGVRGPGIDAHYQYLSAPGEFGFKDIEYFSDEHGPGWLGMQTPSAMSSLAYQVAAAYRASNDAEQRGQLREAYLLLADHVHDQALQAGSGFKWNWWVGGAWADAVFLMRDVLEQTGRLQAFTDFLLYTYGAQALFAEGEPPSHMDFFNLTVPRLLSQCLLQVEPAEQVRWLNAFKAMLEQSMLRPASALKIDGSAYHHAGHYHSYAQGAFINLPPILLKLSGTPWRLTAEAHERLKRAMLAQRLYANRFDLPVALTGRSPFVSGYGLIAPHGARALGVLARCGTPDGSQEADPEVAAAYLRLVPEAADDEPYPALGITPEPEPSGTFVMPYAGLLCHRGDDWLVGIKGQSKYVWGTERQAQRNCYGLFMGLGNLEVLAGGSPVSAVASGRQGNGWDWRRFEGTTVPQLPLETIDKGWTSPYSPETFVGGLSHRGRDGVFAMILNQPMPGKTTLRGRKSWFFSGRQVLCLGSDISCDEEQFATQTTLCQRGLTASEDNGPSPTPLDGGLLSTFPEERSLDPATSHWFIDVQQTGYYIPAGQTATVARRHQVSRDVLDAADTEGDFLTAWIDHGPAPTAAAYEYLLVVRADPEDMQSLAATPPYRVMQRDEAAHIVWDAAGSRWACVFFAAQEVTPHTGPSDALVVTAVDRPCLIMAERAQEGRLCLTIADPDLNLDNSVSRPRPLQVTLRGQWHLQDAKAAVCAWQIPGAEEAVRVLQAGPEQTVLEVICEHGASYELELAP